MKKFPLAAIAASAVCVLSLASISLASASTAVQGALGTDIGISARGDTSINGTVKASGSAEAQDSSETSTADSDTRANANANANANAETNADSNSRNDSLLGSPGLDISGDDVRGTTSLDLSVNSSAQVRSENTLKAYAQAIAHENASVRSIAMSDSDVKVTYNRPAWLFGIIPVTIAESADVAADANGKPQVSVSQSWWAFLASKDMRSDKLESSLKAKLSGWQALSSSSTSANAAWSASAHAEVLASIQAANQESYAN